MRRQIIAFKSCCFLLAVLAACDAPLSVFDWRVVSRSDQRVIVEVRKGADKNLYREAMPKLCPGGTTCRALFWEEGDGPQSHDPGDDDLRRMSAFYSTEAVGVRRNLRYSCTLFTSENGKCLTDEYIRDVVKPLIGL